jgi:hypothetical protein
MNGRRIKMKKLVITFAAFLFILATASAEEPQYTNSSFGRLSHVTGNVYLQRASDLGYEEATVNMPISEGDRLGTTDGRAEVFLGKGNYLRLDEDTKIDFISLPKKDNNLIRVRVWAGNVYLRVRNLVEEKTIELHTPDVSVYVLDQGLYRVDVRQDRETEIFVFEGMVEAAGETGSVLVKDEQRLEVSHASFTSNPSRFYAAAEDSFDRWSEDRDRKTQRQLAKAYLPEELEDFENELAEHGYWAYVPLHGYVWVPYHTDLNWRPYYYGRWTWLSLCGWTWLPYEPWGWCTYHFGRWHWNMGLGWYWIPTTLWGPAWVSWYWGYDYFGWAPLSYYGYPAVIVNNVFYDRYHGPHYPYNNRALTVIHKNQLKARNVSEVALGEDSLKTLGKISLSSQAIPLRPARNKISVENLEDKKLILRKTESEVERTREAEKQTSQATIRRQEPKEQRGVEQKEVRRPDSAQERKIVEKKPGEEKPVSKTKGTVKKDAFGYPSSPEISAKNYERRIKIKRSTSDLTQIYRIISGSRLSNRRSSSSSSQGQAPKRVSSSSKSRSSSSAPSRSSSSSRSSSGSGKVRKK